MFINEECYEKCDFGITKNHGVIKAVSHNLLTMNVHRRQKKLLNIIFKDYNDDMFLFN